MSFGDDMPQRTNALAYWRYAHDYLRSAKALRRQHELPVDESQAIYHLAARSLAFAMSAWLRMRGYSPERIVAETGGELAAVLALARQQELPPMAIDVGGDIERLATHLTADAFRFVPADEGEGPRLEAIFAALVRLLDETAEAVARDYVEHYAGPGTPPVEDFVRRLKADLSATNGPSE